MRSAVIVTAVLFSTFPCTTLKVAEFLPARTLTVVGGEAASGVELDKVIVNPPVGAIPVSFTVPVTVVVAEPFTVVGVSDIESRKGCWTVIDAVLEDRPSLPTILTKVDEVTAFVVIANFPEEEPIGTDAVAGRVTADEFELSLTATAPLPAPGVAFKVTVPVDFSPPVTSVGFTVIELTAKGSTDRIVVLELFPYLAVMISGLEALTNL